MKNVNPAKRIIIIGAGYAGVKAALVLHKKMKDKKKYEITLIDKNPYHTLMTEIHEVAGGRIEPDSLRISLKKIFAGRRVNIVTDEVFKIDFGGREIITGNGKYNYDYLVIATGAEPVFYGIPGVKENCFTLWSLDDAVKIREHIEKMFLFASRETDPDNRASLLTFVVAGAGLTGIELAGELVEWTKVLCERYFMDMDEVKIKIVEAKETILPTLPASLQKKAKKFLEKKKVQILTGKPITEVKHNSLIMNNGESSIYSYTIIWTCGVEGGAFAGNLSLTQGKCVYWEHDDEDAAKKSRYNKKECRDYNFDFVEGKHARITVNEFMQSVDRSEVYIIGDVVWFKEKDKPLPQIVETALQTAETAAINIYRDCKGLKKKKLKPAYHGQMVSIGSRYCLANIMNIKFSGFMAMAMKHLVNIHYLLGICGVNLVWDYIRREFLDIKDKRSMVGGHAAGKTRFYWIILLRLFLGVMWLVEGGSKVYEGWLDPKNIFIVQMPGNDSQTNASVNDQSAANDQSTANSESSGTADSQTSASAQGNGGGITLKPLIKPLWIYKWFEQNVIVKAPFVFQAFVVITEILIGLALVGGLFTFLASAGSIGLVLMFLVSGLATREIFWYIFAAIVMMGGAGKSGGLDYWVMPWFKRFWNSRKIAWKTYFYIDNPVFKKKKKKKKKKK